MNEPNGQQSWEAEDQRWSSWMAAAQRGDAESYESLLRELERSLGSRLRRMLGGNDLVEDCLQECLVAIHRARHTYDTRRPFKPWAYSLARYKTIDVIRKRSTERRYQPISLDERPVCGGKPQALDLPLDVGKALQSLDGNYREAVLLTKFVGYTLEEAAEKAGVSRTAMRSRVHRGLKQLRRAIERDWQEAH